MAKIKLQPEASSSNVFTIATPAGSADRVITLPDATGTLLNSDGSGANLTGLPNGSQLDHSGSKKIEAVSAGAAVTGNLTTTGNISTGNNGMVFILDSAGQTSGRIVTDSSAANALEIGADPNNQAAGSYTAFRVDNTERMRITPDGLTFNGDTAAANALDDYEEGTWTIAFQGADFSGGNRTGYYVKVGNLVHATVYCGGITISNVTGAGTCSGVPYSMASLSNHYAVGNYVHGNAVTGIQNFYLDYTNNKMYPTVTDTTSSASWVAGSNKHLMISVTYRTA